MARTDEVQRWLDTVEVVNDEGLANLSIGDRAALEQLIGHGGMKLFLGLLLGTRQAKMVQLSNLPLTSPEAVNRAAITQGQIQGIDVTWQTLLEIVTPVEGTRPVEGARE